MNFSSSLTIPLKRCWFVRDVDHKNSYIALVFAGPAFISFLEIMSCKRQSTFGYLRFLSQSDSSVLKSSRHLSDVAVISFLGGAICQDIINVPQDAFKSIQNFQQRRLLEDSKLKSIEAVPFKSCGNVVGRRDPLSSEICLRSEFALSLVNFLLLLSL